MLSSSIVFLVSTRRSMWSFAVAYQSFPTANTIIFTQIPCFSVGLDVFLWWLLQVAVGTLSTAQLIPNKDNSNNGFTTPTTLPLQVDVNLLYFSNPQGIVYSGKKCDFFPWGCDIKAWGYTDLWVIDWLIDCLTYWWAFDWLIDWLIDW